MCSADVASPTPSSLSPFPPTLSLSEATASEGNDNASPPHPSEEERCCAASPLNRDGRARMGVNTKLLTFEATKGASAVCMSDSATPGGAGAARGGSSILPPSSSELAASGSRSSIRVADAESVVVSITAGASVGLSPLTGGSGATSKVDSSTLNSVLSCKLKSAVVAALSASCCGTEALLLRCIVRRLCNPSRSSITRDRSHSDGNVAKASVATDALVSARFKVSVSGARSTEDREAVLDAAAAAAEEPELNSAAAAVEPELRSAATNMLIELLASAEKGSARGGTTSLKDSWMRPIRLEESLPISPEPWPTGAASTTAAAAAKSYHPVPALRV